MIMDNAGCTSDPYAITITPTNCREEEVASSNSGPSNSLNIFPNPANSKATVAFTSDKEEVYILYLIDVTGRGVLQYSIKSTIGENQYQMDLSQVAKGIYMILLQNEDASLKAKIVVQ